MSRYLRLAGLEPFTLTPGIPFVNIGERTNVTGSAKFRKLITNRDYSAALDVARDQVENGAQIIDINMDEGLIEAVRFVGPTAPATKRGFPSIAVARSSARRTIRAPSRFSSSTAASIP